MNKPIAVALAGVLVLVGCAATPPEPSRQASSVAPSRTPSRTPSASVHPTASPSTTPPQQRCLSTAANLSRKAQVGQLIMVGVNGPLTAAERKLIAAQQLGSVVLLGDQPGSVKSLAATTAQLSGLVAEVPVVTAADQEGGLVQRLNGPGFTTIPNANRQAQLSDVALRTAAQKWGSQLAAAGVRWNLAPVADVVPRPS